MANKGVRETITFSCDPKFKELIKIKVNELGYQNKSQMIRDALQQFFESEKGLSNIPESITITAIITVAYDHHDQSSVSNFMDIQHSSDISYSFHHHMDNGECLENLIIHDKVKNVKKLLKLFRAVSGLKYISVQIVSRSQGQFFSFLIF
jgi:metal-responsive CopG/Arc/MetJ family transcriptional regulator